MRAVMITMALCASLFGLTSGLAIAQPPAPPGGDIAVFTSWLAGEFDNFQQISEQKENKVAAPHGRIHTIITPLVAPSVGTHVFLARESKLNDVDTPGGLHVYAVVRDKDVFVLKLFSFRDPAPVYAALKDPAARLEVALSQLQPLPGCDVTWRRDGDAFAGTQAPGACRVPRWPTTGTPATLVNTYRLTEGEFWFTAKATAEDGTVVLSQPGDVPFKLLRARSFVCWAALRKTNSEEYDGWRNLVVHDQGQWVPIPPDAGKSAKYAFELSQLRYAQQRPVMKLAIYEAGKELAVAYTWTEPDGRNIGMNLRWVQVGCKITP
jgi:hypothetical protein